MRTPFLPLLLVCCLCLAPAWADEPPAKGEETPGEGVLDPSKDYGAMEAELREVPYAQRRGATRERATKYLETWAAAGREPVGAERYYIGLFQRAAERHVAAQASLLAAQQDDGVPETLRDQAALAEAQLLHTAELRTAMGTEAVDTAIARLASYASAMSGEPRTGRCSALRDSLAGLHDLAGRKQVGLLMRLGIASDDPSYVSRVTRSIVYGLMGTTHDMQGYGPLRARAADVVAHLRRQQGKQVERERAALEEKTKELRASNPDALDEAGRLKKTDTREMSRAERAVWQAARALRRAEGSLQRIDGYAKPFAFLGKAASPWTLEKAFGDVEQLADLEGKVVVIDFWATWCPWCIRSFPAIRDLLKDYADEGLVVVGVTASAGTVYAQRYDLDDDLKHKAEPGKRAEATARLASSRRPADGKTVFEAEAFREKEKEVIAAFIQNHQMTWPVVMIDKSEPAEKYALGGWPHAVVLDRRGRVRYFKSGALLRDRPEAVAAFREVLEDLLAEK